VRRLYISFTALIAGLALTASACGSVSPYAAKVDNAPISQDTLEKELRSIAANGPYLALIESKQPVKGTGAGTFDAAFTALALTRQIYYGLIATELVKRKLAVGPPELAAARAGVVEQLSGEDVLNAFPKPYQDELIRRQAELDLLTLSLNGVTGSAEDAAKAYYDAHHDEFAKACVSHILVGPGDKAKADDIKGRLSRGEDFATVAKAESIDTQSAAKGGELGCDITPDTQFVPGFLAAIFTQPVGQVGDPVMTQFGYHLIKVTSKTVPPYDEAKAAAREKLTTNGQEKLLTWLQETVSKAKIEINPKYGTFDKEGASPGVVPPAKPAGGSSTTVPSVSPAPGKGAGLVKP